MRYSDKDKDIALRCFCDNNSNGYTGDRDILSILFADGYIETLTSPNGTVTRATDKGKAFYFDGGYSGAKAQKEKDSRKEFRRNIITAIIGSLSGFIAGLLANLIDV